MATKIKQVEKQKTAGGCIKCSCPGFRSGDPDSENARCINIRPPTQKLCGHLASEHSIAF